MVTTLKHALIHPSSSSAVFFRYFLFIKSMSTVFKINGSDGPVCLVCQIAFETLPNESAIYTDCCQVTANGCLQETSMRYASFPFLFFMDFSIEF